MTESQNITIALASYRCLIEIEHADGTFSFEDFELEDSESLHEWLKEIK